MPDDVSQALERFQTFLGRFPAGGTIDADSGFTVGDGMLIVGKVELAASQHVIERGEFDDRG